MEESEREDKEYTLAKEIHEAVTHVKGLLVGAEKVDGKNLQSILSSVSGTRLIENRSSAAKGCRA